AQGRGEAGSAAAGGAGGRPDRGYGCVVGRKARPACRALREGEERLSRMEPPPPTPKPKLITSSARDDVAAGTLAGLITTLVLAFASENILMQMAMKNTVIFSSAQAAAESARKMLIELLLAGVIVGIQAGVFRWLRRRLPDFSHGYRRGALIIAAIFA